jgi:hypothetical protein
MILKSRIKKLKLMKRLTTNLKSGLFFFCREGKILWLFILFGVRVKRLVTAGHFGVAGICVN